MRVYHFPCLAASALLWLPLPTQAQNTPSTPARAVISNGSFERTLQTPNLWGGTDREGNLSGFRSALPVLSRDGSIGEQAMPVSVALGDLNGDGLLDILSADPLGYIRIYFNSGSKESPKFTLGEFTLPFLALSEGAPPWTPQGINSWEERWNNRRRGTRVSLADTSKTGKLDIVAGNYFGDLFLIKNTGSATVPRFDQPQVLTRAMISTSKDPTRRWGNVFAPLLHDWDEDGRPDLLLGEGSFSANNIHFFQNEGSASAPVFNDAKRQALALGHGREQLTPTLADFNGDGRLDILVSDREGHVTVYLRPENWKLGDFIEPSGYLAKIGGLVPKDPSDAAKEKTLAFGAGSGIHTIAAGDLNGDGLFDLGFGRSNGRIAWAPNTGSKDKPKFDSPKDIAGNKPTPPTWLLPSQWDISTGAERGNFFAYATVVSAAEDPEAKPPDGSKALKFGYATPANSVIARPQLNSPPQQAFNREGRNTGGQLLFTATSAQRSLGAPTGFMTMRQTGFVLDIGKTYTLSVKIRGAKVSGANLILGWRGYKLVDEGRTEVGERGAVRRVGRVQLQDTSDVVIPLNPGSGWSTVSRDIKIEFPKEKELNKEPKTSEALLDISFDLAAPDGFLLIDDIQLTPKS